MPTIQGKDGEEIHLLRSDETPIDDEDLHMTEEILAELKSEAKEQNLTRWMTCAFLVGILTFSSIMIDRGRITEEWKLFGLAGIALIGGFLFDSIAKTGRGTIPKELAANLLKIRREITAAVRNGDAEKTQQLSLHEAALRIRIYQKFVGR